MKIRTTISYALLIGSILISSGCRNLGFNRHVSGQPREIDLVGAQGGEEELIQLIIAAENAYYEIEKLGEVKSGSDHSASNDKNNHKLSGLGKASSRELYASKMLELSDRNYDRFKSDLVSLRKGFDVSADLLAIGLDTASVLYTPETTKSILAALSAVTTSTKTAFNKTYFYEQTLPLLISQMDANREAVLKDIYIGLSKSTEVYPLHMLRHDMVRYIHAGTVDGALTASLEQANKKKSDAETDIKKLLITESAERDARFKSAETLVKTEDGFTKLQAALIKWWVDYAPDKQTRYLDSTLPKLKKLGMKNKDLTFLNPNLKSGANITGNSLLPKEFVTFANKLSFSETEDLHRKVLAELARNATGLEMPQ